MSRWKKSPRVLRYMEAGEARLILARGGMLLQAGADWKVYRSHDSRRMCVGLVRAGLAEHLLAEGVARPLDGAPSRLGAGYRVSS